MRAGPSTTTQRPRKRQRLRLLSAGAIAILASGIITVAAGRAADAAPVGAGSYAETLPAGRELPSGCGTISSNPREFLTANAPAGAVPTNDWWSSLVFKRTDCAYSLPLHAHPISYDTFAGGLGFSYTTTPTISGTPTTVGEYHYPYAQDILVGVVGLNAPVVRVDGWSDWTVSPYWTDGTRTLRATIGHGLPFAYFQATGGNAQITTTGTPAVWLNNGAMLGFTAGGSDYVAYAPTGAAWTVSGSTITSTLAGRGYFSVALLPDGGNRTDLATRYGQYAHAHVTGTRISYAYNPANNGLTSTYAFTTTAREGSASGTVVSLYPHQWRYLSGGSPIPETYTSARGAMRTLIGVPSVQTQMTFLGVLPEVPAVADSAGADLTTLDNYLAAVQDNPEGPSGGDTYWAGKGLGRAARIAEIADQVGNTAMRDSALTAIRNRLNNWLTASPGETAQLFYYNANWGTLIGYPASYGSDLELNDHHFHYGYFIAAAATLAKFDAAWASSGQYGGMIDLLIRDANNYDRNDTRFPYLRDFDIYAGHDWASGHGSFGSGNNQESSSEGQNFANALIQWGQATGNTAVRDAGIFLYTTQAAAIQEYWFDSADQNFPAAFGHSTVGMVWGDGGAYATWFSGEPEMIQGINMLPITGGHLYLGYNPSYVNTNYAELVRNNGGPPTVWQDILWEFQALGNGDAALANFRANSGFTSEEGESKAHTFHWIRNLAALGTVDTSVTANHPLTATFVKNGARTYVASNVSGSPITVTFSTGTTLNVPAGRTVTSGAFSWSGGGSNPPTTPPTTNLALNKPATASSVESAAYPASAAVDGSATTRWASAFSDPQWIQVDLGATYSIDRVRLVWEAAYGSAYQIQTSTDGTTWTTARTVTGGNGGEDDNTGLTASGRYVRINGTTRATAWGYSLFTFEVYGAGTPPTTTNVALNKPATASSVESAAYPASAAVDASATTRWASAFSDPQWIQVDLGATYAIDRVRLVWEAAYGSAYQIQTSTDGTTWTTARTVTGGNGGEDDNTGLTASGRYVRINGTTRATAWGYSLFTLEVYGR